MGILKKRKILQIFSNGSLNFCYNSFFSPRDPQLFFYEIDLKNFHYYNKSGHHRSKTNDSENLFYRKKYVASKD